MKPQYENCAALCLESARRLGELLPAGHRWQVYLENAINQLSDAAKLLKYAATEPPRAEWRPITDAQKDGQRYVVSGVGMTMEMAWYRGGRWCRLPSDPLFATPTHYLANIPPVPEPVKAPTLDECVVIIRALLGETSVPYNTITTSAHALLARAKEARG